MEPLIDLTREYGLVLDGGGARGAYQIGAWRALKEAGVHICAVSGTSVGALNGALVCMDDLEKAEKIWNEMIFSRVMDVDDDWMEEFFRGGHSLTEVLAQMRKVLAGGGVDVTPLKNLIHEVVDEEKIVDGSALCEGDLLIGLGSGYYPANKAVQIPALEAIKSE